MNLQQRNIVVDRPVQSKFACRFVESPDSTEDDCPGSIGDLVVNVGVFEHRVGLVLVVLPYHPGLEILLATKVCFMASFIHLKRAPLGHIGYMLIPIIPSNDAHFRFIFKVS
jgi:hypothetical protein